MCRLQGVLVSVPLTVLASTLVGHLWRTYSVALQFGSCSMEPDNHCGKKAWLLNFLGFLANIHVLLEWRNNPIEPRYNIRAQVSRATVT